MDATESFYARLGGYDAVAADLLPRLMAASGSTAEPTASRVKSNG